MLQVEEIGTVTQRLQLSRDRSHDGDDETVFQFRINRPKTIKARASLLPHQVARQEKGDRLQTAFGERLRLPNTLL